MSILDGARNRRGVTLTELLVVLLIVSILATIAVPVYVQHAGRARIATAQQECQSLAEGEEACASLTGFYVPLQLLNDLQGKTGLGNLSVDSDAIGNESGIFLVDVEQNILNTSQKSINDINDPRVLNLVQNWAGPFMTFNRFYIGLATSNDPQDLFGNIKRQDYPMDPWGNPYRFYSPNGIIGSLAASTDPVQWRNQSFSDGLVNQSEDRFDRYVVVSFGPDGIPNNRSVPRVVDDIFYYFGKVNVLTNETDFTTTPVINTPTPTPTPSPQP